MDDEVMREALRKKVETLRDELGHALRRLDVQLLLGEDAGNSKRLVRNLAVDLAEVVSQAISSEEFPLLRLAEPGDYAIVVVRGHEWPAVAKYAGDGWWMLGEDAASGGAERVHALDLVSASLVLVGGDSADEGDVRPRYLDECERVAIHANGKWRCEDSCFDSLAEVMQVYAGVPVVLECLGREWPSRETPSSTCV